MLNNNTTSIKGDKKDDACCSVANKAGKKLREEWDSAESQINEAKTAVVKQIRSKPIQSGLIATAVGFVLGALWRR